jgi:hypothetical protein
MFLYIGKGFLALIGAWAVIAIIIGGFRMILAQGNEEAYGQANKSIQRAVIGVVVALLSFSIIAIVQDLLSAIEVCSVNGSWVYQGRRLSDGASIVLTNVAMFPGANRIEAYNEGWTYSLRPDGFHLINPSGLDNFEPWVSIHSWKVP